MDQAKKYLRLLLESLEGSRCSFDGVDLQRSKAMKVHDRLRVVLKRFRRGPQDESTKDALKFAILASEYFLDLEDKYYDGTKPFNVTITNRLLFLEGTGQGHNFSGKGMEHPGFSKMRQDVENAMRLQFPAIRDKHPSDLR